MSEPRDHKSLKKPDVISSFEFRGEIIHVEWFDISDISELPDLPWQQVYAVGNVGGQVPVVHFPEGNHSDNLPGGQVEEGESIEEALERELQEEVNMRVLSWRPIGYQKISNKAHGTAYQLRVYAVLEPIGEFVEDPGGSVIGYSLVSLERVNEHINYGEVGDRIIGLVRPYFSQT